MPTKRDPLRNRWYHMKEKCYQPSCYQYPMYGGLGITVCDEWKNDYFKFAEWSLTHGYDEDKELIRIDIKGNYEPSNCKYVTLEQKANTRRTCRFETYNGVTASVRDLCRIFNKDYNLVRRRLQSGMLITRAMDDERKRPYMPVSAKKSRKHAVQSSVNA